MIITLTSLVFALIIVGVDLYDLIYAAPNADYPLRHGEVIETQNDDGWKRCAIRMQVREAETGELLKVVFPYRRNLRWWTRPKPQPSDEVYFNLTGDRPDGSYQIGTGLGIGAPCSRTRKIYDQMFVYENRFGLYMIYAFIAFAAMNVLFFHEDNDIIKATYMYGFQRFIASALII